MGTVGASSDGWIIRYDFLSPFRKGVIHDERLRAPILVSDPSAFFQIKSLLRDSTSTRQQFTSHPQPSGEARQGTDSLHLTYQIANPADRSCHPPSYPPILRNRHTVMNAAQQWGPYATYSPTSGQVGRHDKTKLVDTDARMNIAVGMPAAAPVCAQGPSQR
ncbi:hypothetical protein An02g03920 [Aspergillus niger]|uniref:Uncharacterized protein n=2 Tax=Aspergillus niger TaxID=5061 RepID=A2QCK8_ASPNC|nr:hypothetical protein An02g03920 [Aspergillus niger]CAL00606.1 hypothetical protein An02g03920 [Aspergillus niger]